MKNLKIVTVGKHDFEYLIDTNAAITEGDLVYDQERIGLNSIVRFDKFDFPNVKLKGTEVKIVASNNPFIHDIQKLQTPQKLWKGHYSL